MDDPVKNGSDLDPAPAHRGEPAGVDAGSPLDSSWFPYRSSFLSFFSFGDWGSRWSLPFFEIIGVSGMLGRYPGPDCFMGSH